MFVCTTLKKIVHRFFFIFVRWISLQANECMEDLTLLLTSPGNLKESDLEEMKRKIDRCLDF